MKKVPKGTNLTWHAGEVDRTTRASVHGHVGAVLWFTGLSGSGKSTLSRRVEHHLLRRGVFAYVLDGDNIRHGLNADLGFSKEDRHENIRRVGEVSRLFVDAGAIVLAALISPYREDRNRVRTLFEPGEFLETYVAADLETCEKRDPKGLYARARKGEIPEFTGVHAPYEIPQSPEIQVDTERFDIEQCAHQILTYLDENDYLRQ